VLTCNHVSFVDPVLLMAASPRPIYFVMDHRIFKTPVLGWLFRLAKAIPIAPRTEDPALYEAALKRLPRCCATATCWPSSRKAASPKTANSRPSRAAS
jgi:1-acyl-sn-glycerol-3-phosphate acyltransferase